MRFSLRALHNLSLQRKQMVIIMMTSSVVLLLACASFIFYDVVTFRRDLVGHVSVLAEAIGKNCAAAIDFNDAKSARETLDALHAETTIISACVYTHEGQVFAVYQRSGNAFFTPPKVGPAGYDFTRTELHLFRPILQQEVLTGTIFVAADLTELSTRLTRYLVIAGFVFLASLLVALGLSSQLQRVISRPILNLAGLARAVALEKNYSLRAMKRSEDEIGELVDGFNEMLAQIQQRDAALQRAQQTLEQRVAERTQELASSLSLLDATLQSTADGILVVDREYHVTSFNAKFVEMWRLPREKIVSGKDDEILPLAVAQVRDRDAFLAKVQELYEKPDAESHDVFELKDGRIFERYSQPQRLNGAYVGRVWCFRDVTERKLAEVELAYERDLFRNLLDNTPDHIYFKDAQLRLVEASKSEIEHLLRVARISFAAAHPSIRPQSWPPHLATVDRFRSYALGKTDAEIYGNERAATLMQDEQQILRTGMPMLGKIEKLTHANGKIDWFITTKMPWRGKNGEIVGTFGSSKDITDLKEAEAKIEEVHKQLLDASRKAGMAEIATNVLHNVGNVLNSVNVSASLVIDRIKKSHTHSLLKVVDLLKDHEGNLGDYITSDSRGRNIPPYLHQLAHLLAAEEKKSIEELDSLRRNIDHIKEIVTMQQSYAKVSGLTEMLDVRELVEDSLRMSLGALNRDGVKLIREFGEIPPINSEKHKILQILINLVRNAKYACFESNNPDKRVTVRVTANQSHVQISVIDNGVGIPADNLKSIFNHGFTTRKDGHGFGLHSGALAAKEMGGMLTVQSDGIGHGATFTLELPFENPGRSQPEVVSLSRSSFAGTLSDG